MSADTDKRAVAAHSRRVLARVLEELEAEASDVQGRLDALRRQNRAIEQRMMAAIQAGDDRSARAELIELQERYQTTAPLEADLTVLRAITSEYRRSLEVVESDADAIDAG